MHLKAISIKEELLGSNDYEVGLSIGHLASLYNFHMDRYRDAEKLYYRSIAISMYSDLSSLFRFFYPEIYRVTNAKRVHLNIYALLVLQSQKGV